MTTTSDQDLARIFTSAEAYADDETWHAAAARLRAESPVFRVAQPGWPRVWAILKHADVMMIERKHQIFPNTPRVMFLPDSTVAAMEAVGMKQHTLIHMDDPDHRKYRALTIEHFTAGALRRKLEQQLRELAKTYVDRMVELGAGCDFASDIAKYYPLQVILTMLGVPAEDQLMVLRLAQQFFGPDDPEFANSADRNHSYTAAITELRGYLGTLTAARRAEPTDDMASVIANSRVDGELIGDLEAVNYYTILATAGHDTTSSTMAGGLEALIRNPETLRALKDDPSLIKNAVEEMLRWTSPVKCFTRQATQDFELRGTTIRAGERVLLSFASANRDEEVFDDPFRFDIGRANANRNIAFGFGKHHCLGAELARMELRIFFTELLSRIDEIEIAGPVMRVPSNLVSGVKHLPVRYSWRA